MQDAFTVAQAPPVAAVLAADPPILVKGAHVRVSTVTFARMNSIRLSKN